MDLVFVHPEIPHNSGCAARLAAATGVRLHLVEPLGFSLEDRYLKRAGLDYWPLVDLVVHPSWDAAARALDAAPGRPLPGRPLTDRPLTDRPLTDRLRLFTARGGASLFETAFAPDDVLVFGRESDGLPPALLAAHPERRVYVPVRAGVRSLNLANVAALGLYTALHRAGVPLPDNDGSYEPIQSGGEPARPADVARRGA